MRLEDLLIVQQIGERRCATKVSVSYFGRYFAIYHVEELQLGGSTKGEELVKGIERIMSHDLDIEHLPVILM